MSAFKDGLNREWVISITCGSLKRVVESAGFDIADFSNGKLMEMVAGNVSNLVPTLWPLVKSQAEQKSINEESFADGLFGAGIDNAVAAIKEALLDFYPPSRRPILSALLKKADETMEAAFLKAEAKIAEGPPDSESGGSLPTTVPESLESPPTIALSENSAPEEPAG
jgi:hypothetical protein